MLNLDQLRTLQLVVSLGSFTRAAEALGLQQSTVSFQVKALESSLGVRLIDRVRRGLRPTPAGRVALRQARRLIALAEETAARVRAETEGRGGRVSLAVSTIVGEYFLPPALARFRETHPGVYVVAQVLDSERAARALLAEACDLALVGARFRDRRIEWRPFAEDEVVLVAPGGPGSPALARRDLARVPLVLREPGSGTRDAVAHLLPKELDEPGDVARVEVGSTEAARRCAIAGLGYTFISRTAVADDVASGRLRVVRFPGTPVRRAFHVARLRATTLPAAARAFVEVLAGPRG